MRSSLSVASMLSFSSLKVAEGSSDGTAGRLGGRGVDGGSSSSWASFVGLLPGLSPLFCLWAAASSSQAALLDTLLPLMPDDIEQQQQLVQLGQQQQQQHVDQCCSSMETTRCRWWQNWWCLFSYVWQSTAAKWVAATAGEAAAVALNIVK